jgi:hypothetical protein
MRTFIFLFFLLFAVTSCKEADFESKYNPNLLMNQSQQDSLTYSIIRYMGKMPKYANDSSKFEQKFDSAYNFVSKEHRLIGLFKDGGKVFFLYARQAPSLEEKYVAIAGFVELENQKMIAYEEVFRTWKKKINELEPLAFKLFDEMIQGKDLSVYYPENSGEEYIIEFPSAEVLFDKESRKWLRKMK